MERVGFLDKALLQALIYSLIAHILLFGTFKIRLNDYKESAVEMAPIDVAIDIEEPLAMAGVHTEESFDPEDLYFAHIQPDTFLPIEEHEPVDIFSDEELIALGPKEPDAPKMYPLQLKLSQPLKKCMLIEDGSSLFRNKEPYETMSIFHLATHRFSVEYKAYVDGETGTITRFEKKCELLDKKLQQVADRIMSKIAFAPCSEKTITGSITLTFSCTGEEIKSYLHD